MTSEVLLPADILVRALSICVSEEDLPISYKSKDGDVKERNSATLKGETLSPLTSPYLNEIARLFKDCNDRGKKYANVSGTLLDANYQAWMLIKDLTQVDNLKLSCSSETRRKIEQDFSAASAITSARVGTWVDNLTRQRDRNKIESLSEKFVDLYSLATQLEEVRDKYNKGISRQVMDWKRNGNSGEINVKDIYSDKKPLLFYQVGTVVIVHIPRENREPLVRVMTNVHYSRVITFLKTFAHIHLFSPDIYGLEESSSTTQKLMSDMVSLGVKFPNAVGGIYKTARQILFLMGDKSNAMGSSPVSLHLSGLSEPKLSEGSEVAAKLLEMTGNRKSALNLANIYKSVLQPDTDMTELFNTIAGSKAPNIADPMHFPRFDGVARKAVFSSLSRQGISVRSSPKVEGEPTGTSFSKMVNATSVPTSSLLEAGYTKWSSIKFEKVRGIFDQERQDIPVSNKSSAPNVQMSKDMIEAMDQPKSYSELKACIDRLRAVNDVVTTLSGESELDFKSARARFRGVIREHEAFEAEYANRGVSIDNIPSEDLEEFVESDPSRAYTVTTEPKLGEVQKQVTRMFYMAEQALKVMTQVCERFTKKIISKASGVSIVKSNRARRKELEEMLNAYSGLVFSQDDSASTLYISFDMSEFSKKFPNSLVRLIGSILSELSGEDWMSRIDVFFRAAIVYHSSRGFLGAQSGIKGGFEGFLNFLWTLVMKVVMDIATKACGVEGVLAVYSDDGLLRLYIPGGAQEVKLTVTRIQKVFKSYGLIFHMDKTVASREIMEYLGVYGEKGMVIPTWIKELCSVGRRKTTPGLETTSDKINLWSSQTDALVKAQAPPTTSSFLQTFLAIRTLRVLNADAPSRDLAVLTIIPFSAGGFRVNSISEKSILSSIEPLAEFAADLELCFDEFPVKISSIVSTILSNLKKEKDAEKALITGSLLQTTLTDTSGLGIARDLIDSSSIGGSGAKDPVTREIVNQILTSIRGGRNIQPRPIRSMIQSIPDVIEFNKSIAIMKSSAALKFVEKDSIKRAQYLDGRKCRRAISFWLEKFRNFEGKKERFSGIALADEIISKVYPSYDIATLKESPRTALAPCGSPSHIIVTVSFDDSSKLLFQEYKEPEAKFLGAQLSPEFAAEGAASTEQRRFERFTSASARLVATNPSYLGLYYAVASAFKLPCPSLPSATVISAHRSSRNFGASAVSASIPAPYHGITSSVMTNSMWGTLKRQERADRTTYVESARVPAYLMSITPKNTSVVISERSEIYMFNISSLERNCSNPTFDIASIPPQSLIDEKTTKAFSTMLVEENAQMRALDSIINTNDLISTAVDIPTLKGILLSRFTKWLYNTLSSNTSISPTNMPVHIPYSWRKEIMIEAAASVSLGKVSAAGRANISRALSRFLSMTDGMTTARSLTHPEYSPSYQKAILEVSEDINEFRSIFCSVILSLSSLDLDDGLSEYLSSLEASSTEVQEAFIRVLKRNSVTGGLVTPTVVINSNSFADTKMSKEVKKSIKEAVYSLLQSYTRRASELKRGGTIHDTTINFLVVLKHMLRPSGHRNTPFNKHMVAIQLVKLTSFINKAIYHGRTEVTIEELDSFRLDKGVVATIIKSNAVIRGETPLTTGEDMRKCLNQEGIPNWAKTRINYILKRLQDVWDPGFINDFNAKRSPTFFQDVLNYVMQTYADVVKDSVDNLAVHHSRVATAVVDNLVCTPVEDASVIFADISGGTLLAHEVDISNYLGSESFNSVLGGLLVAHYNRWGTNGYSSIPQVNDILKANGIFGSDTLSIRSHTESPFDCLTHESDYTLTVSSYMTVYSAANNYLHINRLPGGMAVVAKTKQSVLVIGLIPKGTQTQNTETTDEPHFIEGCITDIPINDIETVAMKLVSLGRRLGGKASAYIGGGEQASVVIQQSYQRMVGAHRTVVDDDPTLVAIAELVRGAWSLDAGIRVLGLFTTWITTTITTGVTPRSFRESTRSILNMTSSSDSMVRLTALSAVSAVWEWVKLSNITQGPNIDSQFVLAMVQGVNRKLTSGGAATTFYNMAPKPVSEIVLIRGQLSPEDFIMRASATLFIVPHLIQAEPPEIKYEEPDGDEW